MFFRLLTIFTILQEIGFLPILILLPPFGVVLWLLRAVYDLFKGLFGASFKVCLRGCLGLFYGCLGVV